MRQITYRVFYDHMVRKGYKRDTGIRFYPSLIREDICLKMMFKHQNIFTRCLAEMLTNCWVTKDGPAYKLGIRP